MKKLLIGLLTSVLAASFTHRAEATITGFDDLTLWAGSGPNQSGLVIQWNDSKSPTALAWGFNWTASSTLNDMLLAVMSADVNLFARGDSATNFGPAYFGFGYSNSGNFSVTGAVDETGGSVSPVFVNGFSDLNTNPSTTQAPTSSTAAAPSNALDRYSEGWNNNGFWELYEGTGSSYPSTWNVSFSGASAVLANNTWYAFSITAANFDSNLPGAATAAVPEPSVTLLILIALFVFLYARKRLHSC